MKRYFIPALLVSLLCLLPASPARAFEEGSAAPDFKLKNLNGETVRLSDFKGQVIVLKLATTWCPTCKQQSEVFKELSSFLESNKVQVVEVFVQDTEEMVKDYLQKMDYSAPHAILLDDGAVYRSYNVYLIPRVLLIDKKFTVRRDGNILLADELKRRLEALL